MNAVNLIPSNRRPSGPTSLSDSWPFLGVLATLVLVLLATFLFVNAHDRVSSSRAQLVRVQASTQRWQATAASFAADVAELKHRSEEIQTARSLAGSRYDWSLLLGQLAGLMPSDTQLLTMTASDASASSSSAASSTSGTTTDAPGISISGCATSQTSVAAAMVALRRIEGVSQVSLATSSKNGAGGTGGGSCAKALPVSFQLALTFQPPSEGGGTSAQPSSTTINASAVAQ